MRNYSLQTLNKMLSVAETIKPCGNWGDGMRKSKLPSMKAWNKARDRVEELKRQIEKKKIELEEKVNV